MMQTIMTDRVANTDEEWKKLSTAESSPFVRSLGDWEEFVNSAKLRTHALGGLDPAIMDNFRKDLKFVEVRVNGEIVKQCCISWHYGELIQKGQFSHEQVLEVAAVFGVGADRFARTADKFGDICDGDLCCRPRLAFNCPDGNPDCGC
jgi:hypothetical protein